MKRIVITSQAEYDKLPQDFVEFTEVNVQCNLIISSTPQNSTVRAYDTSTVTAYGSSTVTAYGSSTVTAYGSSTVRACGSSTVTAYGNAVLSVLRSSVTVMLFNLAVATFIGCEPIVKSCEDTATIVRVAVFQHTTQSFTQIYSEQIQADGRILLYKSVQTDATDFYSGTIKYEGIVECPDWDPNPERECGGGLHLSPAPELALSYNKGKIKRCLVHPDDIVVYPPNISKVRCHKVEVLPDEEE